MRFPIFLSLRFRNSGMTDFFVCFVQTCVYSFPVVAKNTNLKPILQKILNIKITTMEMNKQQKEEYDQFEGLIQGLIDNKYGCSEDFMNVDTVSGLRDNVQRLSESGEMQAAGLGNKKDYQKDKLFRGDRIKWLENTSVDQYEAIFFKKVGNFISHLNKTCFTAITGFESHYANYEQGSFYKRHLDQFKTDKGRKYSIVLYLNENWLKEDGGMLSLYPEDKEQKDIFPMGGRMVFFKSDEMEHEVHPSFTRERISIAGWLKA